MRMTRVLGLALAAIAALATPTAAQIVGSPQSITVVDSGTACVTAPTACATFALDNSTGGLTISVSGTWTGTLTFEGTNNDAAWTSLLVTNLASAAQATTTTAGGLFAVLNAGVIKVRVRATATITGTALITAAKGLGFARAGPSAVSLAGLVTTSTDGLTVVNPTAATVGVPVQISPRTKWCGTAYNSVSTLSETDCFFIEALPVTAAGTTTGTFRLGYINPAGSITYPLTVTSVGLLTAAGTVTVGAGAAQMQSSANGLVNLANNTNANAVQVNVGTAAPTLTTCGTGTVTAHSTNTAGEVTATGASTCTVTFGAPNFTNQPFCVATDETSPVAVRISAISVSAVTFTNLTSGDKFLYHCLGGS